MSEQDEQALKATDSQELRIEKLSKEQIKNEEISVHVNAFNSSRNDKPIVRSKERPGLPLPEDEYNQSSCTSEDGTGSVYYIVSSEDETTHSYNDEDDDKYIDNEDMERKLPNRRKSMMLEDEEDDNEEEHDPRIHINDNDDTDIECEQDCFDGASDNFLLNKKLNRHHRKRSLSLQDLSYYKRNVHTQHNKRKESLKLFKYLNLQPYLVAYSNIYKTMQNKTQHMENTGAKIIKQEGKKSRAKNIKDQESIINRNHERNKDNNTEQLNAINEMTKDKTEAVNESQTEETQTANLICNTEQIVENNENNGAVRIIENGYVNTENQCNHIENEKYIENSDKENVNESIDVSVQVECNDAEMTEAQESDNNETNCGLKITNVKSIFLAPDEPENLSFVNNAVDRLNTEVTELKTQFRQFQQNTLTEKIKKQQEIDALKKSLAKYEDENQTCETNEATENGAVSETTSKEEIATSEQLDKQSENFMDSDETNKMSTSLIEPVTSYTSETTETVHNPAKSNESSDSTSFVNTEDNVTLSTSTISKSLSSTFITSTRILQTLSNIMQGKVESLPLNNSIQTLNQKSDSPIITSSRKRKREMLDPSSFTQYFKIPNTSAECENRNDINLSDVRLEHSVDTTVKPRQEDSKTVNDSISVQTKMEYPSNGEDSVKFSVYKNPNNVGDESFLIQAKEPINNSESEKDRIQECGPFLLGNLEVRMSETNGKINIWGKEINSTQNESESGNEEDLETSRRSSKKRMHWQDTAQTKFNRSLFMCSTSKKKRTLSRSNISRCSNLSFNAADAQLLDNVNNRRHADSFELMSCEHYNSSKCENNWSQCDHTSSLQERIHSCCIHHTHTTCNCEYCRQKRTLGVGCRCGEHKFSSVDVQPNASKDTHVLNPTSSLNCTNCQMRSNTSNENFYEVPMKQSTKTAETKKQKLSDEKIRGILLDFLRAHEGGHDSDAISSENKSQQQKSSQRLNDPQQARSSTSTENSDRCCDTCESRLATQLGKLEMRMERVQSRLNIIVDMLNKLQPMDIN